MKRLRTTCPICGISTDEAEILFHRDFSPHLPRDTTVPLCGPRVITLSPL